MAKKANKINLEQLALCLG